MKKAGLVVELGPIAGREGKVHGIAPNINKNVSLYVNGKKVISTHSLEHEGAPGSFYFSCEDLSNYIGDGDVIFFESEGEKIFIDKVGYELKVRSEKKSRFSRLSKKLDSGFVFPKSGKLALGWSDEKRMQIKDIYEKARDIIKSEHNLDLTPCYGNLLGAVRERDFIPHDVGQFDCSFLSSQTDPVKVRNQCVSVVRTLVSCGFRLGKIKPYAIAVKHPSTPDVTLDLNWSWFDSSGIADFSCGSRYDIDIDREGYVRYASAMIGDWEVLVPGNADKVLYRLYGPNWRIPDQGLQTERKMRKNRRFNLSELEVCEINDFAKNI